MERNYIRTITLLLKNVINEPELIMLLNEQPLLFKFIPNPSYEIKYHACKLLSTNIQYIKDPDDELLNMAICTDIENVKYIKRGTKYIKDRLKEQYPLGLLYLENLDKDDVDVLENEGNKLNNFKSFTNDIYMRLYHIKPNIMTLLNHIPYHIQYIIKKENPKLFVRLKHLESELITDYIESNPNIVLKCKNATIEQYRIAVENDPRLLLYAKDDDIDELKHYAKFGLAKIYNDNITKEMVEFYPILVILLENHQDFDEYFNIAIHKDIRIAKLYPDHVKKSDIPYILTKSGWFIRYLKNEDYNETNILLSLSNGQSYVAQYIDNLTIDLQRYLIDQDPNNIQYINNPDASIMSEAISKSPFSIRFIKKNYLFMSIKAIRKNPNTIEFIKDQTEQMQNIAFDKKPSTAKFFKNPSREMKRYIFKKYPQALYLKEFRITFEDLLYFKPSEVNNYLVYSDVDVVIKYLNFVNHNETISLSI